MFQALSVVHCVNYWYFNFNRYNSSHWELWKRQNFEPEITLQFWEANSPLTWWDKASQSWTRLSSWIWIRPHIFMVKIRFSNVTNSHLCIELRVVCTLTVEMLGWGKSALQHGPVLWPDKSQSMWEYSVLFIRLYRNYPWYKVYFKTLFYLRFILWTKGNGNENTISPNLSAINTSIKKIDDK